MANMKKKLLSLILSAVMVLSLTAPVLATEFSSGEDASVGLFTDSAASIEEAAVSGEGEVREFSDDGERLSVADSDTEFVTELEPILRPDPFTPVGTGCDTPSVEEVLSAASSELYTAGENSGYEELDPADVKALLNAVDTYRSLLVKRQNKITISLKLTFDVSLDAWNDLALDILLLAMEETGNSVEGDYLRWNFAGINGGRVDYDSSKGAYIISETLSYYTTYEQEQKVTSTVNRVLGNLGISSGMTPYMKIRKIYDYICSTVTYDYAHVNDDSYLTQFTAYGAAIDQTAVCQGYSLLLYRMLTEAGITNRMIPSRDHIWNIVFLRDAFYNVDATWDAEVYPEPYEFFLMGDEYFDSLDSHARDDDPLFGDYDSAEFRECYPTSYTDYQVQTSDTAQCSHVWSAWEVVYEPSCLEEGVKGRYCSECGLIESAFIAKTAHKWKYTCNKNNTHQAVCTVCGSSKKESCTFSSNTCTKCRGQRVLASAKITKVSSAGYNKLKITWNKVEGATGYVVQYLKGSTWKELKRTTATSYTHTGTTTYPVKTGTTYYYRVCAYYTKNSKNVYGGYSAKTGGKSVPDKPVLVSAKAAAYNKITIQWKKAAGATGYLIYRKNGTKWEQIASVNGSETTSYTHASSGAFPVIAGTTYVYTVRSYTSTGKTKGLYDSTGKSAKTSIGTPTLTLTKISSGLKTSWKKVSGASGYQIQRYEGGKWTVIKTVSSSTLSYTDQTAKKGKTYQYRIRAYRTYSGKRVYSGYSAVKKLKR